MAYDRYAEKLKDPRWREKREVILKRDGYCCVYCDNKKKLQVHHKKYDGEPWESADDDLVTLCEDCHMYVHLQKGLNEWELYLMSCIADAHNINMELLDERDLFFFIKDIRANYFKINEIEESEQTFMVAKINSDEKAKKRNGKYDNR